MSYKGKVLGNRKSQRTARLLANKLAVPYGEHINHSEGSLDFVFRYGNTDHFDNSVKMIFNKAHDIILVSNKLKMRHKLIENGIPVPKVYDIDAIEENKYKIDNKKLPLIARPVNHWKGRDFNLVYDYDTAIAYLRKGYYLQEVINKETEYRIFVWQGRIFECNIKKPRLERYNMLVRNFGNGWGFGYKNHLDTPQGLRKYARDAVSISGLNFGGVDCCIDKEENYYIFEINSAPSLIERKAEKLAKKVTDFMGENYSGSPLSLGDDIEDEENSEDANSLDPDSFENYIRRGREAAEAIRTLRSYRWDRNETP